ncbi:hypothetical protein MNV49_004371 [Pseudohyphozyma bogoriensis]|nr:hypothetical protein MNV49_004371 [Pseudohyphozyma bogoriensis]
MRFPLNKRQRVALGAQDTRPVARSQEDEQSVQKRDEPIEELGLRVKKRFDDGFWTPGEGESSTSAARTPAYTPDALFPTVSSDESTFSQTIAAKVVNSGAVVNPKAAATSSAALFSTNGGATRIINPTTSASSSTGPIHTAGTISSSDPEASSSTDTVVLSTYTVYSTSAPAATSTSSAASIESTSLGEAPIASPSTTLSLESLASEATAVVLPLATLVSGSYTATVLTTATIEPTDVATDGIFTLGDRITAAIVNPSALSASLSAASAEGASAVLASLSSSASLASASVSLESEMSALSSSSVSAASASERLFSTDGRTRVVAASTTSSSSPSSPASNSAPSIPSSVAAQASSLPSSSGPASSSASTSDRIFSTGTGMTAMIATATSVLPNGSTTIITSSVASTASSSSTSAAASTSATSATPTTFVSTLSNGSLTTVTTSTIPSSDPNSIADAPTPAAVTSRLSTDNQGSSVERGSSSSSSKAKTTSSAAGSTSSSEGDQATKLFGSIKKSPASITVTVLIALLIAALALGLLAFCFRRHYKRRRAKKLSSHAGDSPETWFDQEREKGNPFRDSMEADADEMMEVESAVDVLPASMWARRTERAGSSRPATTGHDDVDENVEESPRTENRVPSSDWTSIVGDHEWPETEDGRSRAGSTSNSFLAPPVAAHTRPNLPSALRNSFVPETPSIYSHNSSSPHSSDGSPELLDNEVLNNEQTRLVQPSVDYSTLSSIGRSMANLQQQRSLRQPPRPRESWRLSLDRVMGAAADFVNGKTTPIQEDDDEDRYTSFAARNVGSTTRKAPPPPLTIRAANDPRDIPATFTPLSSTYSAQFAFNAPPLTEADLENRAGSPRSPPSPPMPTSPSYARHDSTSIGQALTWDGFKMHPPTPLAPSPQIAGVKRSISDATSDASSGRSRSRSPVLNPEYLLPPPSHRLRTRSLTPSTRRGSADTHYTTASGAGGNSDDSDNESWIVAAPTSRNPSGAGSELLKSPGRQLLDPPLPPVKPLFSPNQPFQPQQLPETPLTRAAAIPPSPAEEWSDDDETVGARSGPPSPAVRPDGPATMTEIRTALSGSRPARPVMLHAHSTFGSDYLYSPSSDMDPHPSPSAATEADDETSSEESLEGSEDSGKERRRRRAEEEKALEERARLLMGERRRRSDGLISAAPKPAPLPT